MEEEEDEELLEDLDEDERIIEDEEDLESDQDLEFEEKASEDEQVKSNTNAEKQSKTRDRLFVDDFEFECDLTDSERNLIKQKMNETSQPKVQPPKKTKSTNKTAKRRKTSQSSDENLFSPYRRQSVGHSPTNRGVSLRPQLINTKRQKKFKSRLHVDAYKRRYSDVFFSNTPPISQPVSQPSSRLSNISDQIIGSMSVSSTSRPSSANKLDSRPQSALENNLFSIVQQQQSQTSDPIDKQQLTKDEFKLTPRPVHQKQMAPIASTIQPTFYVRNRSPSCAVVPSHYVKQGYIHHESSGPIADKPQSKRRGMSLSFTPTGARQLTNQVTRKLSKQLSKFNQSTRNLLTKAATPKSSPKSKDHSVSVESSKDVVRDISEFHSSFETLPSSSIILSANVLIYPMINSPVQATLNQASLAAVANTKLDQQFAFDNAASDLKTKEHQAIGKDGHMFKNQMKKAKNVFRSFIPLQLQADTFTSSLFDLKECLPATYCSSRGIDKSIKVRNVSISKQMVFSKKILFY